MRNGIAPPRPNHWLVRTMKRRVDFDNWQALPVSLQMTADRRKVGLFGSWQTPPCRPDKDSILTSFHCPNLSRQILAAPKSNWCRWSDSNRHDFLRSQDFKSCASAISPHRRLRRKSNRPRHAKYTTAFNDRKRAFWNATEKKRLESSAYGMRFFSNFQPSSFESPGGFPSNILAASLSCRSCHWSQAVATLA